MGPSRSSQTFPSHAAGEGLYRSIMGHRDIRWKIHQTRLLHLSHRLPVTTNELKQLAMAAPLSSRRNLPRNTDSDTQRTLRTTVYLRNVAYAIEASLVVNGSASDNDLAKYREMFARRAVQGQTFRSPPYLGLRECAATWELIEDPTSLPAPKDVTEDYGICYYDTDYEAPGQPMYYCPLRSEHGVLSYPSWDEVRALGIVRHINGRI